jgi:TolB-like protein/tetratricopeptide (TPR) repeat protein
MSAEDRASAIDLGREADFRLGGLAVRPSRRELVAGAERSIIEPRVMQVLVALARRAGEVVSRDELIATCWDGRIVGDDAINACVAKVRRAGEAAGAYEIETIPRVGYRLTAGGAKNASGDASPGDVLLAVLPFENLSGDPELGYFSDGVSEEILQTLAQRARLKVVGRASSFQFRGGDKTVARVVAELGATHILDGSVRRSSQRVRVAAQLVDCATQTMIWTDRFDCDLSDIFALEDEIAAAVSEAMRSVLAPAVRSGAVDPIAYDLYLRATTHPERLGIDDLRQRRAQFEEAIRRSPTFADAWGGLGYIRARLADYLSGGDAVAMRADARKAAERALELDPRCAMAARALARAVPRVGSVIERDLWLGRALEWAPHDAVVNRDRARLLAWVGRSREALLAIRLAHRLDPLELDTRAMLGRTLLETGDLAESATVLAAGVRRWPEFELFARWLSFTLIVSRRFDEARALIARHDLGTQKGPTLWMLSVFDSERAAAGERAVVALRRQLDANGWMNHFTVAIAAQLGRLDDVFELTEAARLDALLDAPDPEGSTGYNLPALFMQPLPAIRCDRRFPALCAKAGLVEYWLATGAWPDCVDEVAPYYDFKAECARVAG